jgi:hypothetical protein
MTIFSPKQLIFTDGLLQSSPQTIDPAPLERTITTCISCRRLMTLIIDNLTKGNRKTLKAR